MCISIEVRVSSIVAMAWDYKESNQTSPTRECLTMIMKTNITTVENIEAILMPHLMNMEAIEVKAFREKLKIQTTE